MPDSQSSPVIGVVGLPDGWSTRRLADAVVRHIGQCPVIDLEHVVFDLDRGTGRHDGLDLAAMDALIVKKVGRNYGPDLLDRLELLHFLESRGVRVFSKAQSMIRLLDRLSCTVTLRAADIPMPPTVITEDATRAAEAVGEFGKAVLKPLYTSKARGMLVVQAGPEAERRIADFQRSGNPVLYVQKTIELPGSDLGIAFLGGKYVGSYARAARNLTSDPHASMGTQYWQCEPGDEIIALAQRAQDLFDLDFTCVDIAESPEGPVVFEVSAFGGFRGLLAASQIDAAELYTQYVLETLRHAD